MVELIDVGLAEFPLISIDALIEWARTIQPTPLTTSKSLQTVCDPMTWQPLHGLDKSEHIKEGIFAYFEEG